MTNSAASPGVVAPMKAETLSVVIPAYKARFLDAALCSLAGQSQQGFEVVVADDASPQDLHAICDRHARRWQDDPRRGRFTYLRFDHNLGGTDLVSHWARAVEAASHDWIWLMGDDDELEPQAVEQMSLAMHRSAQSGQRVTDGIWRTNVQVIDENGKSMGDGTTCAPTMTSVDYVRERLLGRLPSYACEYVFRRERWRSAGGFVSFPLAWCSDDATWLRLAGAAGFRTVHHPAGRACWRRSGLNISSRNTNLSLKKLEANLMYLEWLFLSREGRAITAGSSLDELKGLHILARDWLVLFLSGSGLTLSWGDMLKCARRLVRATGGASFAEQLQLLRRIRWATHTSRSSRVE